MKVLAEFPPNYNKLVEVFAVGQGSGTVFCYGDKIYNPFNLALRDDLIYHESIHAKQQYRIGGPENWWKRYIKDPKFRIDQEIVAYGKQVAFLRSKYGEEKGLQAHQAFSGFVSGPVYGNAISRSSAFNRIGRISRQ